MEWPSEDNNKDKDNDKDKEKGALCHSSNEERCFVILCRIASRE